MAGKNPRKGAIGVKIDVTVLEDDAAVDLSSASTKNYIIEKPDGTIVTWAAGFVTTGTNGQLRYTTLSGDLNQAGRYKLQVDLVFSGSYDGPTDIGAFVVEENIQ
jgi:hypothetical protein